jgi:hypothetical protein
MNFARIFVTSVLVLVISLALSFINSGDKSVALGNEELKDAARVEAELNTRFGLILEQAPADPSEFSWIRFSLADRQAIKERVFAYLAHMNRVMEIDSQKGIYITGKSDLLAKMEFAQTVIKSALIFEQRFGESFDPKKPAPLYKQAVAE